MIYAKLSTAITIPFGPVLDSAGAEYTGAAVGDVKISKNNGTPAALNGSATLTHKEVGMYELVLTTSDISAVGQATLQLSKTTYVAPPVHLIVLPAKVYDSIVGGTDNLEVDTIQWLGVAPLGAVALYSQMVAQAAAISVVNQALGSFADEIAWDDPSPHPHTLAHAVWMRKRMQHHVQVTDIARATNYYFDQDAANDAGAGTLLSPFKSMTKARSLRGTNVGLWFKRGKSWVGEGGLDLTAYPLMTWAAYGTGSRPLFDMNSVETDGAVWGAGSVLKGIKVGNCGIATPATQNWACKSIVTGTDVALAIDCDFYDGSFHTYGTDVAGGGTPGGITYFVNCLLGGVKSGDGSGTPGVSYNYDGGQRCELWYCTHYNGVVGAANALFISHTNGGTAYIGGMVFFGNTVKGGMAQGYTTPYSLASVDPSWTKTTSQIWEYGTRVEPQANSGTNLTLNKGWRINCYDSIKPADALSMGAGANAWAINCAWDVDLSLVSNINDRWAFWNKNSSGIQAPDLRNCHIRYRNKPANRYVGLEYTCVVDESDGSTGTILRNTIFSRTGTDASTRYFTGIKHATEADHNAFYLITSDGANDAYTNDANKIILDNEPVPLNDPIIGSQMYGTADVEDVPLEFDFFGNPRSIAAPNIGPIESGMLLESVASAMTDGSIPINFGNTLNASATLALSGTTIKNVTDINTKLGTPAGASVSADIAANLAAVLNVQNNTFIGTNIPAMLERPDSGSTSIQIVITFADETGAAKNIDSSALPTVLLVNNAGTNLSSRLSAWTNAATGKYTATYTNTSTDAIDDLHWEITGTVNSKLRRYVALTQIVDTTAVDFTSTDRSNLAAITESLGEMEGVGFDTASDSLAQQRSNLTALAGKFTGITLLAKWLGALAGKTSDASTRTEINATTAGATYNETTDSQEATRDRGDAAWAGGGGGSSSNVTIEEQDVLIQ